MAESVMRKLNVDTEGFIPAGREPYVYARVALNEMTVAIQSATGPDFRLTTLPIKRTFRQLAEWDEADAFESPLSPELSDAVQEARDYGAQAHNAYLKKTGGFGSLMVDKEETDKALMLVSAVIDHGSVRTNG